MKALLRLLVLSVFIIQSVSYARPDKDKLPVVAFRDLVIFNHFNLEEARKRTIGIEVEMVGLPVEQVTKILVDQLGGHYAGSRMYEGQPAYYIEGTSIGTIRIEPVNFARLLERSRTTRNVENPNELMTKAVNKVDDLFGQLEIVTEPINYDQVKKFALAVDQLGLNGAKGSSNLGRFISIQANIGIDYSNAELIKNILANYYRNKKPIRKDVRPILMRHQFLSSASDAFIAQLNDPNWHPTVSELFDAYQAGSNSKLTRVQLFNALISNAENFDRFEQPKVGKKRPQRPVAEMREADTKFSNEKDPTLSSRHIMREVDFAIALVNASETTGSLDTNMEEGIFLERLKNYDPQVPTEEIPSLREVLAEKNYTPLKVRAVSDAEVLFTNPQLAATFGITGTPVEISQKIKNDYAIEVDNSTSPIGVRDESPNAPIATAHNDGAGGVGDGRALVLQNPPGYSNGNALSLKGSGLTPYQIHGYATTLGLHTGGVDGKMSFKEGVRTWVKGEVLYSLGILSERAISIIDNKGQSVKKDESQASAQLLRQLPGGGIRNSHINHWDAHQTREGLEYLKQVAGQETGNKFTDSTYVVFDAVKSGELAARMQDFLLIHGALAKGNVLAYPGLVDISGISFLSTPDPEYASFAYLSRFGNQANTLKRLLKERKDAYTKTAPRLKDIDEGKLFDDSFNKEISILAIMRLGYPRAEAETLFNVDEFKALRYGKEVWEYQFGRLSTDVDLFQSLIPQMLQKINARQLNVSQAVTEIMKASDGTGRPMPESRRNFITVFKNKLSRNYRPMSEKEARSLLIKGMNMIRKSPTGTDLNTLVANASRRESLLEGLNENIDSQVKNVVKAQTEGNTKPAFAEAASFLSQFDARVNPAKSTAAASSQMCIDLLK